MRRQFKTNFSFSRGRKLGRHPENFSLPKQKYHLAQNLNYWRAALNEQTCFSAIPRLMYMELVGLHSLGFRVHTSYHN